MKKKTLVLIIAFSMTITYSFGQITTINSGGGWIESSLGKTTFSYSIGGSIIESLKSNSNIITQDFQQPYLNPITKEIINTVSEINFPYKITVFPNPVRDEIIVKAEGPISDKLSIEIYDMAGKMLIKSIMATGEIEHILNLQSLISGDFMMIMRTSRKSLKTVKITKIY
jgi:hypothetical protein